MKKRYEKKIKVFIPFIIISPNSKTAEWRYIFLKGDKIMKNYLDEKESFLLYTSFYDLYFSELTTEEKGILIDCVFRYARDGITDFETLEKDRGLRISFKAIIDVIDRNNQKWNESKERRRNAAKQRWAKNKTVDTLKIEMPGESSLEMTGNISNMPKNYDELKKRTGIANYEELRKLVEYCNHHEWAVSLEEMQQAYEDYREENTM